MGYASFNNRASLHPTSILTFDMPREPQSLIKSLFKIFCPLMFGNSELRWIQATLVPPFKQVIFHMNMRVETRGFQYHQSFLFIYLCGRSLVVVIFPIQARKRFNINDEPHFYRWFTLPVQCKQKMITSNDTQVIFIPPINGSSLKNDQITKHAMWWSSKEENKQTLTS